MMRSGTTLSRCDVVVIPFPYTDLSSQKRRPVLVLTEVDDFGDFIGVAITSQSGHVDAVLIGSDDLTLGQLPKTSWVRTSRLFSLNESMVIHRFGILKPKAYQLILQHICAGLGCAS